MNKIPDAHLANKPPTGSAVGLATGRKKLLGHLAMMLFAILISESFSLGSMAVSFIEPGAINTVRFIFASVIMGGMVYFTRGNIHLPSSPWRFMLLGGLMGGYFILMFAALQMASPVSTAAVFTLIPLMSAGFGYFILAQTTRPVVLVSLIVAGIGAIWVIFRGDINALIGFDVGKGEMVFFVGCMAHAAYSPLVKRLNRGESVIVFTFWTLVASTFWIALYGMGEVVSTELANAAFDCMGHDWLPGRIHYRWNIFSVAIRHLAPSRLKSAGLWLFNSEYHHSAGRLDWSRLGWATGCSRRIGYHPWLDCDEPCARLLMLPSNHLAGRPFAGWHIA